MYACVGRYDKACDVYQEIVEASRSAPRPLRTRGLAWLASRQQGGLASYSLGVCGAVSFAGERAGGGLAGFRSQA